MNIVTSFMASVCRYFLKTLHGYLSKHPTYAAQFIGYSDLNVESQEALSFFRNGKGGTVFPTPLEITIKFMYCCQVQAKQETPSTRLTRCDDDYYGKYLLNI